jgi:hypothetical protein
MQSIPTGDPDSLHPEEVNHSKQWKGTPIYGESTYCPSDRNKLLDIVDSITKGILQDFAVGISCFNLSFDHSSVLITQTAHALNHEKQPSDLQIGVTSDASSTRDD